MAKRRTIGENPLDSVVPRASAAAAAAAVDDKQEKRRMTFHLPITVTERVKNTVYWTPGLTLADLAAQALADAVDRIEKKRGEAFPRRKSELKGGRPIA
jgi:hypothetical protein